MKLAEVANISSSPTSNVTDAQVNWLMYKRSRGDMGEYFIQRDGTIDVNGSVIIYEKDGRVLPVTFGKVTGGFDARNSGIASIDGFPCRVGDLLTINNTAIISLHNIHNVVKFVGTSITWDEEQTHILGLLLINGVQQLICAGATERANKLNKIMNAHIDTRDIISAQDDLIYAGLEEHAQL